MPDDAEMCLKDNPSSSPFLLNFKVGCHAVTASRSGLLDLVDGVRSGWAWWLTRSMLEHLVQGCGERDVMCF